MLTLRPALSRDSGNGNGVYAAVAGRDKLPDADGRKLLSKWQESYPDLVIIIMTAYSDVNTAVDCLKAGAYDFLTKPVDKTLLLTTLNNTATRLNLSRQVISFNTLFESRLKRRLGY